MQVTQVLDKEGRGRGRGFDSHASTFPDFFLSEYLLCGSQFILSNNTLGWKLFLLSYSIYSVSLCIEQSIPSVFIFFLISTMHTLWGYSGEASALFFIFFTSDIEQV